MIKINKYKKDKKYVSIKNEEYNFRMNLKRERNIPENHEQVSKIKDDWDNCLKYFRYKKRYSFMTPDKMFRFDLTVVKSNDFDKVKKKNFYKHMLV